MDRFHSRGIANGTLGGRSGLHIVETGRVTGVWSRRSSRRNRGNVVETVGGSIDRVVAGSGRTCRVRIRTNHAGNGTVDVRYRLRHYTTSIFFRQNGGTDSSNGNQVVIVVTGDCHLCCNTVGHCRRKYIDFMGSRSSNIGDSRGFITVLTVVQRRWDRRWKHTGGGHDQRYSADVLLCRTDVELLYRMSINSAASVRGILGLALGHCNRRIGSDVINRTTIPFWMKAPRADINLNVHVTEGSSFMMKIIDGRGKITVCAKAISLSREGYSRVTDCVHQWQDQRVTVGVQQWHDQSMKRLWLGICLYITAYKFLNKQKNNALSKYGMPIVPNSAICVDE